MKGRAHLVGVLPAAGYATRLQPLAGSKETHPIHGRPVIDYLIERMQRAGCDDIRVVTRPEKRDVLEHARRRNLTTVLAHPRSVSESFLAGLAETEGDDVVLFGFPDTIWEPVDGYVRLVDALEGFEVALGLFRGGPDRSDVVELEPSGVVTSMKVQASNTRSQWIWGCAGARRRSLDALAMDPEPGALFASLCPRGEVVGVPLSGPYLDVGTPEALRSANREPRT